MSWSQPALKARLEPLSGSRWVTALRPTPFSVALAVALVFCVFVAISTEGFLTGANLKAIAFSASFIGIAAIGATAIMVSGNLFSLSLGTSVSVAAITFLAALRYGLAAAIVLTLLLGVAVFAIQGLVVGIWDANPIIVTIGAGAIQVGITTWLTSGANVGAPPGATAYETLGGPVLGVPFSFFVLVGLTLISAFVLHRTRFGRALYLMGESRRAARAAGLGIPWITAGAFAFAGLSAATAGVLLGAFNGTATMSIGGSYTYDAIAAALVGGNAIQGGRGSAWRAFSGALIIAAITDLLLLRGYSRGMQILVEGIAVVVVVLLMQLGSRRSR
jgi:ribose/xylose/arabinose/galactoside ABC-type transport system permease subunit